LNIGMGLRSLSGAAARVADRVQLQLGQAGIGMSAAPEHSDSPCQPSKKPPPLHRWRISLIKSTPAATLGYVEAP
jgi:hypothetical protein